MRRSTATARTPAARCALPTSARPCACRAGCTACATTAGCCSSTCATTTASPRSWPIPTAPRSRSAETVRSEWVIRVDGSVRDAPRGHRQPRAADRRGRAVRDRDRGAVGGQGAADPGVRRARLPGRSAPAVPLPRSAARDAAQEHHAAARDHRPRSARRMVEAGFFEFSDADPDRVLARRRARLPRALAHPCRQVLRAAAGAAAVQAAADGRRASTAISRSRPASATRTRAPTGCRASSTSSTSR